MIKSVYDMVGTRVESDGVVYNIRQPHLEQLNKIKEHGYLPAGLAIYAATGDYEEYHVEGVYVLNADVPKCDIDWIESESQHYGIKHIKFSLNIQKLKDNGLLTQADSMEWYT